MDEHDSNIREEALSNEDLTNAEIAEDSETQENSINDEFLEIPDSTLFSETDETPLSVDEDIEDTPPTEQNFEKSQDEEALLTEETESETSVQEHLILEETAQEVADTSTEGSDEESHSREDGQELTFFDIEDKDNVEPPRTEEATAETSEDDDGEETAPEDFPEPDEAEEPYDPENPRKIDGKFDFIELFVFTLVAVMIITTFFFKHSVVEGSSMENTLFENEHLIISDLFYTPSRGDIVVCDVGKPIVKRVIAVGGDTVEISFDGTVKVNGEVIDESDYVHIDAPDYNYVPTKYDVPEGMIYVMGDHRNMSSDSRSIGAVSIDSVLGRVILRFYPFDKFGTNFN